MKRRIENCRVLVTGGAGFIGSNLVEALLAARNEVVVLDNFMTGRRENLAPFAGNPAFTLLEGDIRDMAMCRKAAAGADYVLHQAALGSVPRSIKDPMTTTEVNISGFVNMLFAAQEAKVKRFVYAASSSTYGDSTALPKVEERIGKPLSPYAITKYVDELFAENFSGIYGVETVGLRYFNVFNGDGSYSRDFTYIDNVVDANLLAMAAVEPEAVNTVYNVAFGERTTLNELFLYLRENLAKFDPAVAGIEPQYGPVRAGDIPHSLADIGKARRLLGYEPEIGVKQGLELAAEWYFNHPA